MESVDFLTSRKDDELLKLWQEYQASKQAHNYLPLYARHFSPVRFDIKKVLEIGVQTDKSVKLWKHYFPNAEIYGVDIDGGCKSFEEERIHIRIGDQGDPEFLSKLPADFDIIIDDGSHHEHHQINTFQYLFQHHMNKTGMYVVEDCENRFRTIDYFSQYTRGVNFWPEDFKARYWHYLNTLAPYTDDFFIRNILGVSFYRYIIFVDKGANPQSGEAASRLRQDVETY